MDHGSLSLPSKIFWDRPQNVVWDKDTLLTLVLRTSEARGGTFAACLSPPRELAYLTVELHVGVVTGRTALAREWVRGSVLGAPPPFLTIRSMMPVSAVNAVIAMMVVVLQTVQQVGLECVNDTKIGSQWQ